MKAITRDEVIISPEELLSKQGNASLRIFDATVLSNVPEGEPDALSVYQSEHILGAVFFNHTDFSDSQSQYQLTVPEQAELEQAIGNIGIGPESEVVVYSTGILAWATRVWWLLRYAGFNNVRVLNGGLSAWKAVGGETESGVNAYEPQTFKADIQPGYFASKAEVVAAEADSNIETVHTLPQQVFDDAHIPNSVCQPCSDFLDNWAALLPDAELKEKLIANHRTGKTITYCGGGVAATVNAIVCRLVGNPDVSVYDGSMSEWLGEGMPVSKS